MGELGNISTGEFAKLIAMTPVTVAGSTLLSRIATALERAS
jgi:hypothetical protein